MTIVENRKWRINYINEIETFSINPSSTISKLTRWFVRIYEDFASRERYNVCDTQTYIENRYSRDVIGMISWDYAWHLSIHNKWQEKIKDHFAPSYEYIVRLLGIVGESIPKQYNFVYNEGKNSKRAKSLASIAFYFVNCVASEEVKPAKCLAVFVDGCGGENKKKLFALFIHT